MKVKRITRISSQGGGMPPEYIEEIKVTVGLNERVDYKRLKEEIKRLQLE